jgi:hypothetical protein
MFHDHHMHGGHNFVLFTSTSFQEIKLVCSLLNCGAKNSEQYSVRHQKLASRFRAFKKLDSRFRAFKLLTDSDNQTRR